MVNELTLPEQERLMLVDLLESKISEPHMDASAMHRLEYCEKLNTREVVIWKIQARLEQAAAGAVVS